MIDQPQSDKALRVDALRDHQELQSYDAAEFWNQMTALARQLEHETQRPPTAARGELEVLEALGRMRERAQLAEAEVARLSATAPTAKQACGACGEPWFEGKECGQLKNRHSHAVCYPVDIVEPSSVWREIASKMREIWCRRVHDLKPALTDEEIAWADEYVDLSARTERGPT